MGRKLINIIILNCLAIGMIAQPVDNGHVSRVASAFVGGYLGNTHMKVSEIQNLNPGDDPLMCVVSLLPEGWLLMSRDFSSMPVLAYSMTGSFVIPEADSTDNRFLFLSGYADQLKHVPMLKSDAPDPRWNPAYYYKESGQQKGVSVTVSPLIKVTWNQNSTWNRFCPADSEGPGGRVYVGCVAVSMAQAMSVFGFPVTGTGVSQYYHSKYGTISQDFSTATYKWDEMSSTLPDDNNSLLLYHCAVAVNMDFSPDGSGTLTSAAASTALKQYYFYSQRMTFIKREFFSTDRWKRMIDSSLAAGCPVIYSGFPATGSVGHAFNIDGVHNSNYYHLNWGWSGVNNGYFTIDNLKPGGSDFTKGHTAIIGIRPYYYPTDVALSDTVVLISNPPGTAVGKFTVVDEATDNTYDIILECDSTLAGTEWVPDYYLDGDSLRMSRSFQVSDGPTDTITFIVSDTYGHKIRAARLLRLTASLAAGDGGQEDAFMVWPVPFTDRFMIELPPESDRISIININGAEVAGMVPDSDIITISGIGWPAGIYIVTVTTSRGKLHSKTIVRQ